MLTVSGSEALAIASSNPVRVWSGRRFSDDFFSVVHKPKFRIKSEDRIFTMGSCFAREVEASLVALKLPLVTKDHGVEAEYFESWDEKAGTGGGAHRGQLSRGAFNKYTIASMASEVRRVLLNEKYENNGLIELESGRWFDPHAAGLRAGRYEEVSQLRERIAEATAQIRKANVVFLTLGLVEGWLDTVTGLALVRAPTGRAFVRLADRFQFARPSYAEAASGLEELIALIRENCSTEMRFVITVSPVPFHATFRSLDVVTANTFSKSLLRAVVDEVSSKYDFVDYFPSFEIVMNSPRGIAWYDDQLHVTRPMVSHVMSIFASSYLAL